MIASENKDTLLAIYDLTVSPITFDILHFLVLADLERRKLGLRRLQPVLVPGDKNKYRAESAHDDLFDHRQKDWRLRNMIMAGCWHLPGCESLIMCGDRDQARALLENPDYARYPDDYLVDEPTRGWEPYKFTVKSCEGAELPSLQATGQAKSYVAEWIDRHADGKKVVCITLRETGYLQARNSNPLSWIEFARSLDPEVFFPVILRDHERVFEPVGDEFTGLTTFPAAVVNLELRAALYEHAYLNLFLASGPTELCWLNGATRYVLFVPELLMTDELPTMWSIGMPYGYQLPFATPYQTWVWRKDEPDAIADEFQKMVDRIEISGGDAFAWQPLKRRAKDPNDWLERARCLMKVSQYGAAEALLNAVLASPEFNETSVNTRTVQLLMADLNLQWKEFDEARKYLDQVLALNQNDVDALERMARISVETGDLEASEEYIREILTAEPNNRVFQVRLAVLLELRGALQEALDIYVGLENGGYRSKVVFETMSNLLRNLGQREEAVRYGVLALNEEA